MFKSPKAVPDQEVTPHGYKKIIEEDTGEVFFIPIEDYTSKDGIETTIPNINGFNMFNPVTLERFASNKAVEYNDEYLEDLLFNDSGSVKFDEEWLNSFMEPTPDINQNLMNSTFHKAIMDGDIHFPTTTRTFEQHNDVNLNIINNISEIKSAVENSPCKYYLKEKN